MKIQLKGIVQVLRSERHRVTSLMFKISVDSVTVSPPLDATLTPTTG